MRIKPSMEDTAAFFQVSISTVERFIRANFNLTFDAFREQNMVFTRHALIRKAIGKALKGDNTMLIFCLKNLCDWRDKPKEESEDDKFKNMSTKDLIILVKEKLPELDAAK